MLNPDMAPPQKNSDSFILCLMCVDTRAQVKKNLTTKSPPNLQVHFESFSRFLTFLFLSLRFHVDVTWIGEISGAPFRTISYEECSTYPEISTFWRAVFHILAPLAISRKSIEKFSKFFMSKIVDSLGKFFNFGA